MNLENYMKIIGQRLYSAVSSESVLFNLRSIQQFLILFLFSLLFVAIPCFAQDSGYPIDPFFKFAWSSNAGWINHTTNHGFVTVYDSHLEGYAWSENIGWIRMGTYIGGGTHNYLNTTADNYGVNNNGGILSGFAWSSNAGWINFSPNHGGVTINTITGEFSGYAWNESIGWINFSGIAGDSSQYMVKAIIPVYHEVTFIDWDDTVLKTELVEHGADATPPDDPEREGWIFTGWDTDFNNVTEDLTVRAEYSIDSYELSIQSNNTDWGTVSGDEGIFEFDAQVTVNAHAETGYKFLNWTKIDNKEKTIGFQRDLKNIVSTDPEYTFNMPAEDLLLQANFELDMDQKFSVTVTVDPAGSGTITGDGSDLYYLTEEVTLEAEALEGYDFVNWTDLDDIVLIDGTTSNDEIIRFNMPAFDIALTANFELKTYTVDFVNWNDDLLKSELVEHGADATPPDDPEREGWTFTGWDTDYTNVTEDLTIRAEYDINSYELSIQSNNTDWGTVSGDEGIFEFDTQVTVNAHTEIGYKFINWTKIDNKEKTIGLQRDLKNIVSTDPEYTFNMPAEDLLLQANFELDMDQKFSVTVTVDPAGSGTITGDGSDLYYLTEEVTLDAEALESYDFVNWTDLDDIVLIDGTTPNDEIIKFNMPAFDIALTANFELKTWTVEFIDWDDTVLKIETVDYGADATPPDDPEREGWTFTGWDTDYTNVTEDLTIRAEYDINSYELSIQSNNTDWGTVSGDEGIFEFDTQVTVNAHTEIGYKFINWTQISRRKDRGGVSSNMRNIVSTDPEYTFNMPAEDLLLQANFDLDTDQKFSVTVTVIPEGSGTITGDGIDLYYLGEEVTLEAEAFEGYDFIIWTDLDDIVLIDGTSSEDTLIKFDMPAQDIYITAVFEEVYLVTLLSEPEDVDVILSGGGYYPEGETVVISVELLKNWEFSHWTGDFSALLDDPFLSATSFEMPDHQITFTAVFNEYFECTLEDALNPSMEWSTSSYPEGTSYWFPQADTVYHGECAAQSGSISHNESTSLHTTIEGAGTLTFWWKVDSEYGFDWLRFYINDVNIDSISGDVHWHEVTIDLQEGVNDLTWTYVKDGSVSEGQDSGWVDYVNFEPAEQGPDASINSGDISFTPSDPMPGDTVMITARVYNIGTEDIVSGTASFYYSLEPGVDLQLIGSEYFEEISPGEYMDITQNWQTDEEMIPQVYIITVVITDIMPNDINTNNNSAYIELALPVELASFTAVGIRNRANIKWITLSETDNLGFNLYRLNTSNVNPYITFLPVKLNDELIPGQGTSTNPHTYIFTDHGINRFFNYTYILESVSNYGEMKEYRTQLMRLGIQEIIME